MANEISITGSMSVFKSSILSSAVGRSVTGLLATMTGNFISSGTMSAETSATAVPLGQVTQPHWAFFENKDAANYVTIRNGAGGADLVRLLAGECAFLPLDPTAVPYVVANTAACLVEFLVVSL